MICVLLPLKLCSLPLKIFSHFLTGMAKEARTGQTLSQIPAPSTYPQSVKIVQ